MSEAAPASAPLERHAWLPYAVLVAVGALLYGRTIAFGFTHYDDYQLIVDGQPYIASLRNAPQTFFHDGFAALGAAASGIFYRPLLWISLMIDAQLGGSQPTVYHLTNVVLHLIACCLVYALLVRLALERSLAAFLALVFCVHPALVVGVAPISGRNDTLLAVFVLSAALLLLAFLRSRSFTLLPAVLLAFGACLFTKETGVAFCAVGPLLVWHGRRREEGLSPRLVALTAGVLAVTLAWLLLRRMTLGAFPLFLSKIPENVPMLVVYVGKTLFPVNLSVAPSLVDTALWPGALALVAFAAAGVSMRERLWGLPGVGLVWYFVFLFPALLAHPDTSGLEHRLYVPMVGMLLFLSGLRLPERVRLPQRALRAGAVLLVCGFAALSSARLPDFADGASFWQSATRTSPGLGRAWSGLAALEYHEGNYAAAEAAIRQAMSMGRDGAGEHLLLGFALGKRGQLAAAEAELRAAIDADPQRPEPWENLAILQQAQGRPQEARASKRRAKALQR